VGLEELEASVAFVDGVCTQAATVGEEDGCSDVWRRHGRRGPEVTAKAVALPVAGSVSLSIGLGLGQWGVVAAVVNLVSRAPCPPPPLIGTVRQGPTSHVNGLDAPDQGVRSRSKWPLGHLGRRST
jgi:hypothetical protein